MKSVNKVQLIGNLTAEPESKFTPSGKNVTTFAIATNREYKNAAGEDVKEVEFTNVEFWGRAAEIIKQYAAKGSKMYVEGRLKTDRYEKDGATKYFVKVVGQEFMFLGGNRSGETVHADEAEVEAPVAAEADFPF
jgi:single-strand DNA-binding protein